MAGSGVYLPAGSPSPDFELAAISSGRRITPARRDGRPLVLIFHDHTMAGAVREINTAVRERYDAGAVLVASVVDLRAVPRLLRGMVRTFMEQAYRRGADAVPPGADPADYVIILPDWKGAATGALRVPPLKKGPSVVILSGDGIVAGNVNGEEMGAATMTILQNLIDGAGDGARNDEA